LKVMAEMLQGLILMQEKGIMHRDIKPSNTVVTPNDPKHQIKIIDFGSCCDWSDPLKMGLMDATNDPMYCAPEQTLNFVGPGKFDVFSVGMTGLRCLFPIFQRGTATTEWPGGRFQYFAEREFPKSGYNLEAWLKERASDESEPALAEQCRELLEDPEMQQIRMLLQSILTKNVIGRPSAQDCLKKVMMMMMMMMMMDARQGPSLRARTGFPPLMFAHIDIISTSTIADLRSYFHLLFRLYVPGWRQFCGAGTARAARNQECRERSEAYCRRDDKDWSNQGA